MSNQQAQNILDEFARSVGFEDGLALDENGEMTFVSDDRFEFALALVDMIPEPCLAVTAHLGMLDGIREEAAKAIDEANQAMSSDPPSIVAFLDEDQSATMNLALPLQGLTLPVLGGALEGFVETGLKLIDEFQMLRSSATTGSSVLPSSEYAWHKV